MKKKSILDLDLEGRNVLIRVDYDVPLHDGKVVDNKKIGFTVATIQCIVEKKAKAVIIISHLGNVSGQKNEKLSLEPVAAELQKMLDRPVIFVNECMGPEVETVCSSSPAGSVILLENLKFHIEEEGKADEEPGRVRVEKAVMRIYQDSLSKLASIYVNDALSLANEALCSVNNLLIETKVCGLFLKKELDSYSKILEKPSLPFVAIIGGLKISTKTAIIENLMDKMTDLVLVGSASLTYMKVVQKIEIGRSFVDEEGMKGAVRIADKAKANKVNVHLPVDFMTSDKVDEKSLVTRTKVKDGIKGDSFAMDIGQESLKKFSPVIARAKTIMWFGTPGRFEWENFAKGTEGIISMIVAATRRGAFSMALGKETASSLVRFKCVHKLSHVSLSGGASLQLMEGKELPGLDQLQTAIERI